MRYNYGAILSHDVKWILSASDYFIGQDNDLIDILREIEIKQSEVQQEFDIFNPNIDFSIGKYEFNKEDYSLNITDNISLVGNNLPFSFLSADTNNGTYYDNTVVHIDKVSESTSYTDKFFLPRDIFTHDVVWLYDLSSEDLLFDETHVFNDFDILPYRYASAIFYKKVEEEFQELHVLSHDTGNSNSVVNKEVAVRELNQRANPVVECVPDNIIGTSIQIYRDEVFFTDPVSINVGFFSFSNKYVYQDSSPASEDYMSRSFLKVNLSNTDKFIIIDSPFQDREALELISNINFNEVTEDLLSIDAESIDDGYALKSSGGGNALNFKTLHMILTEKLSEFYAIQLKLFLDGYDGSGALGELIKFIQDKIQEMKDKYVFSDECKLTPLDNIDEGCNMDCATIALDEPHLMVTKQKLKALVRCSLTCEGVL